MQVNEVRPVGHREVVREVALPHRGVEEVVAVSVVRKEDLVRVGQQRHACRGSLHMVSQTKMSTVLSGTETDRKGSLILEVRSPFSGSAMERM